MRNVIIKFRYIHVHDNNHFTFVLLLYRAYFFVSSFDVVSISFLHFALICDFDSSEFFSLALWFCKLLLILMFYSLCLVEQLICKL